MPAVFTGSKVKGRKLPLLLEKGSHKHLCITVGGFGINPFSRRECIYICMAFHFPQTLLELKHVGNPHRESSIIVRRKSLSSTTSIPSVTSNKTTFSRARCDISAVPPSDSRSYQPAAGHSRWNGWYRTFIVWTGDRGGDRVSIELPLAGLRTNPPNGEANGWLTTAIDSPARPPL